MSDPDRPETAKVPPKVIVTRKLLPATEARMAELFDCRFSDDDRAMTRDELVEAMKSADVLVPTVTDMIDASMIAEGKGRLKLIASFGTGFDHIDLSAAHDAGIIVTNTPGVLSEDTADMVMTFIVAVPRRFAEGVRLFRSGNWQGWGPNVMLGHRIGGKTLGIVGMGRIGEAVARRARAFGLNIVYTKRRQLPEGIERELGVAYEPDLDRLIERSDIVTLHTPLTAETENLIDARRIGLMQRHAYLINTARGELVDEDALVSALEEERIGGAGLDVYRGEPDVNPKLRFLPNVVALPHMGSATFEAREASGEKVIANIRIWSDGHRPPDQVLEGLT